MKHISQIFQDQKYHQYMNKIFCDGVWKHKYNPTNNQKLQDTFNEPNDREASDVGIEMELQTE